MGRRGKFETLAGVLTAFVRRPEWRQAELARHVGVGSKALRRCLEDIADSGLAPLTSTFEHPDVVWRLPRGWHPAGVGLDGETLTRVVRHLVRAPRSRDRDALLAKLLRLDPRLPNAEQIEPGRLTPEEETVVDTLEDAVRRRVAVRMKYFTASRGDESWRHASVATLMLAPVPRFLAVCHRSGSLRTFRVGNVSAVHLDPAAPHLAVPQSLLDTFAREAVNGYRDDEATPGEVAFVVRFPEARWVERNLASGMRAEPLAGGAIRVRASRGGMVPVARFVVGLGDAAKVESADLAKAVRKLALGALGSAPARAVSSIRARQKEEA